MSHSLPPPILCRRTILPRRPKPCTAQPVSGDRAAHSCRQGLRSARCARLHVRARSPSNGSRPALSAAFLQLHLDVIEACDGQQGLQQYLQHGRSTIVCVLLDLMMPVLDGFNAAVSMRRCATLGGSAGATHTRPHAGWLGAAAAACAAALCPMPAPPPADRLSVRLPSCSAESQHGWLPVPIVAFTSEDVRHGSPTWHQCMRSGFNDIVVSAAVQRSAFATQRGWYSGDAHTAQHLGRLASSHCHCLLHLYPSGKSHACLLPRLGAAEAHGQAARHAAALSLAPRLERAAGRQQQQRRQRQQHCAAQLLRGRLQQAQPRHRQRG